MACPFFSPTERAENIALPHPSRLPLGAAWRGWCHAPGNELQVLTNQELESCNLGHAHSCTRLPKERPCDSVRFGVVRNGDGRIVLRFVLDASHLPVEHGVLEYDRAAERWAMPHPDARIQKLAECFLQSQLGREKNA